MSKSMNLKSKIDKLYFVCHQMLFGFKPGSSPPLWLWFLATTVTLVRLIPATFSQWEDPLWALVTQINAPWKITFGFATTDVVHILYGVISKILIKLTGHHAIDFVYRIPSLIAGFALIPLSFAVFSRIKGQLVGTLFCLFTIFHPSFTQYTVDARGYMIMFCLIIWIIGLVPGNSIAFSPVRLAIAYLLLSMSHGLAIILVACFAFLGCYLGPNRHPRSVFFINVLLSLPALVFSIPMIRNMQQMHFTETSFNISQTIPVDFMQSWSFIPRWLEFQFGTPWLSISIYIFMVLMILGVIATVKKSKVSAFTLSVFICILPMAFGLGEDSKTLERYSMICLPFWLWGICCGIEMLTQVIPYGKRFVTVQASSRPLDTPTGCRVSAAGGCIEAPGWHSGTGKIPEQLQRSYEYAIILCGILLLFLVPRNMELMQYPQQDYRGLFDQIVRDYPSQKTIFTFSRTYYVGISYCARQYGLNCKIIARPEDLGDPDFIKAPVRCIIVACEEDVRPEMLQWLKEHAGFTRKFKGMLMPTFLYVSFSHEQ